MTQNRSHAVMAQRTEAKDSADWFPTPPWATRALCEHVINIRGKRVWEPAFGEGDMYRPLQEYADYVVGSDVIDYVGTGDCIIHDFLQPYLPAVFEKDETFDWVITNPPFRLARQFVERGLQVSRVGVAVLVRSVFIESIGRYKALFRDRPPWIMAQFVERVPMVKGRVDPDASTATSYCWLIWLRWPSLGDQTRLMWIPPCRTQLERASDYERDAA